MKSFWWNNYGDMIEIIFSLCRNGRWVEYQGRRVAIRFDYLDYNDDDLGSVCIGLSELEDMGEEVAQMLLQVLDLETT